jgi:hypothetical protein
MLMMTMGVLDDCHDSGADDGWMESAAKCMSLAYTSKNWMRVFLFVLSKRTRRTGTGMISCLGSSKCWRAACQDAAPGLEGAKVVRARARFVGQFVLGALVHVCIVWAVNVEWARKIFVLQWGQRCKSWHNKVLVVKRLICEG